MKESDKEEERILLNLDFLSERQNLNFISHVERILQAIMPCTK